MNANKWLVLFFWYGHVWLVRNRCQKQPRRWFLLPLLIIIFCMSFALPMTQRFQQTVLNRKCRKMPGRFYSWANKKLTFSWRILSAVILNLCRIMMSMGRPFPIGLSSSMRLTGQSNRIVVFPWSKTEAGDFRKRLGAWDQSYRLVYGLWKYLNAFRKPLAPEVLHGLRSVSECRLNKTGRLAPEKH